VLLGIGDKRKDTAGDDALFDEEDNFFEPDMLA